MGDPWAFIDWDGAAPGSRLWDLAWAVLGFVPLSANRILQPADPDVRLRTFVDAYGLDDEDERRQLASRAARLTSGRRDHLQTHSRVPVTRGSQI